MQGRVGPPLLQPYYDVRKLIDKDDVTVSGVDGMYMTCALVFTAFAGGIFFSGGPQLAFNVGKDIYYWKDEQQDNHQYILQNTLVSFNFGAGVHIGPRVEAGIYYNIPLGKTADFTWDKLSSELRETTWSRAKSKTNAWHIALALYF